MEAEALEAGAFSDGVWDPSEQIAIARHPL